MEISADDLAALRRAADDARTLHYAPYSGFLVLAAARTVNGVIGGGSNVEIENFSLSKHAEEIAVLNAFRAEGKPPRPGALELVYVAGATPCGSCRQFTLEFGNADSLWIIDAVPQEHLRDGLLTDLAASDPTIMTFAEGLPSPFHAVVRTKQGAPTSA